MRAVKLAAGVLGCLVGLGSWVGAAEEVAPVDRDAVDRAIDKGVAYLKREQAKDGSWFRSDGKNARPFATASLPTTVGAAALAGLALIESGVKVRDPAVQNAAELVRRAVPDLTHTHALAAALLFLDRVDAGGDELLLRTMGARLLAGQTAEGGWGYSCPRIAVEDVAKLRPEQFQTGLAALVRKAPPQGVGFINGSTVENSCSEFAVMGLWAARRTKVPVAQALATYERSCRNWQNPDGSFPYAPSMRGSSGNGCMTCAGLMGLAYCHASANETTLLRYARMPSAPKLAPGRGLRDPLNDAALKKGLVALEARMRKSMEVPKATPLPERIKLPPQFSNIVGLDTLWSGESYPYMAMWSVERVATTYSLEKVGQLDWYNWGAGRLLKAQHEDGSWGREWHGMGSCLDTAFALLFLRRAPAAPDLTPLVKGTLPPPRPPAESEGND